MMLLVKLIVTSYILTVLITSASILSRPRNRFAQLTPWLKIEDQPHMIFCRLCVGFWVSLGLVLCCGCLADMFTVYGVSYFLATQER